MFLFRAAVVNKAPAKDAKQQLKDEPQEKEAVNLLRPSDLPLYTPIHATNELKETKTHPKPSFIRENLENGIGLIRKEIQSGISTVTNQTKTLHNYYDTAKEHTLATVDYLNEPHNVLPRSGAIAMGGLSGFILAVRGGFFKKVIYTTAGAGVIASLCYPRQAEQFAHDVLFEARKGYAICYNFVKGVKPGDQIPVEPINKFPTSLQDVKFLALDLYDEAKEVIFPKKQ